MAYFNIPLSQRNKIITNQIELSMEDLEMYEAGLKESTSTGDLQELYGFHFQGEYKDICTRTFRFMATANSLDEVVTWFKPEEVEYVKCLGEFKIDYSFMENKYTEKDLVDFGNFIYRKVNCKQHFTNGSEIDCMVSDADLANWRFLNSQNESTIQGTMSEDDDTVYPNEYFDNELDAQAEASRTAGI